MAVLTPDQEAAARTQFAQAAAPVEAAKPSETKGVQLPPSVSVKELG